MKADRLNRAYDQHVESELTRLNSDLEHVFETHAREELTGLENRLDSAHEKHAQESPTKKRPNSADASNDDSSSRSSCSACSSLGWPSSSF